MDLEGKKQWLQRYEKARGQMLRSEEKIRALRAGQMGPAIILDGMPHGHGGEDLSSYAARLEQEEAQLRDIRNDCLNLCNEIYDAIETIENDQEKYVLALRYLTLLEWKEIGARIHKSTRQAQRLHIRGLKNLQI